MNVYVAFDGKPVKVAVVPDPDCVNPPGDAVIVHAVAGKPLNATLPVGVKQDGCATKPTIGADGSVGIAFITAEVELIEVQPEEFVIVKV